ncbi:MAG: hypothetical protein J7513_18280 [Solirubrobacteraceae bacterium]|nr:hypothetical protein [Solirubrobacteraceae bacterium]
MTPPPSASDPKPSCEGCFFGRQRLCALELDAPCATFRPDSPEGLRPQRQLRFAFRMSDASPEPEPTPGPVRRMPARRTPLARPEQPMLVPGAFA